MLSRLSRRVLRFAAAATTIALIVVVAPEPGWADERPSAAPYDRAQNRLIRHEREGGRFVPVYEHTDVPFVPEPEDRAQPPAVSHTQARSRSRRPRARAALASTWCGTASFNDYPSNPTVPYFKWVYFFPSDRTSRFSMFKDHLQRNAGAIIDFTRANSGTGKILRLDLTTSCGYGYIDLTYRQLPNPTSFYKNADGSVNFGRAATDIRAAFPNNTGVQRNVLGYIDGVSPYTNSTVLGQAELAADSTKTTTIHNRGGRTAVVWGSRNVDLALWGTYYAPRVFLHEMLHNMGAVQNDAPRTTLAGHCTDEYDVMCYADGGPRNVLTFNCARPTGPINEQLDCGRNDYFDHDPRSGNYLLTHWNVFDSAFLAGG